MVLPPLVRAITLASTTWSYRLFCSAQERPRATGSAWHKAMQATPPAGKVTLYTTSTPSTRHQKTAIRSITALLAAKHVAYEEVCARARAVSWMMRSRQFFGLSHLQATDLLMSVGVLPQVDLAEEPTRRSGMLSDSGGQSALPQLHVNGKVWAGV